MVEQLKKGLSTVTMKVGEQADAPIKIREQAEREVEGLKKRREAAIRELGKLCVGNECVERKREGLQASL